MFKVQTNLKSYKYPIIKIIVSLIIISFSIFRKQILMISSGWVLAIITCVCFVLVILSIFSVYISISELFYTYSNRNTQKEKNVNDIDTSNLKQLSINGIITLVKENDIINFEIILNNCIVKVGSSSDYNIVTGAFFDKTYYIDSNEYDSVEVFENELLSYAHEETVQILSVDGTKLL